QLLAGEILGYIYAILYSPEYRRRYAENLKIDFPRIPLPGSLNLFRDFARLGGQLVALHLLESPRLDKSFTTYTGSENREVENVSHARNTVWIDKAQTR